VDGLKSWNSKKSRGERMNPDGRVFYLVRVFVLSFVYGEQLDRYCTWQIAAPETTPPGFFSKALSDLTPGQRVDPVAFTLSRA
jgi:hypothetical protein